MTAVRGGADVAAPRNRNAPVTIGMVMDETIMTPNDPSSGGNERGRHGESRHRHSNEPTLKPRSTPASSLGCESELKEKENARSVFRRGNYAASVRSAFPSRFSGRSS